MQALELVAEVWREVCRHIHIHEAADRLAQLMAARMPLADLVIRRIDLHRCCIETAAHAALGELADWPARLECRPHQMTELLAWARRNEVASSAVQDCPPALRPALPPADAMMLAGPLAGSAEPTGLVVVVAARAKAFEPAHAQLLQALLEPLSVAMENDARVRELAVLRASAEADKRALLTRLGRRDISDTIVGADQGLRHVMERVELVARSDAPVLLFGETGTGKEVIARAIHVRSPRGSGPFMRVNCGAIPPELIDSELFGHEKGSFTGAAGLRKGWFERADGGTLFLDEIAELPLAAQVRLLRILQDGSFERVGGQQQLHVDVRIIAATHSNLQAMVADGRFREDLWYRVAVFPIFLPALRERPQDIPELASHLAIKAARRFGLPLLTPSPEDLHLLLAYSWPGNVRELGAVLDRAVILGNGKRLDVATALGATSAASGAHGSTPAGVMLREPDGRGAEDMAPLPTPERPAARNPGPSRPTGPREYAAGQTAATHGRLEPLDSAICRHIEAALTQTHGRIEGPRGAAALLQINPHTLRAKMRKLGIDWKRFRGLP